MALIKERLALVKAGEELSPGEFRQQPAVLKRLKELLQTQEDRFHRYVAVLDRQKDAIDRGNAEEVVGYVDLEEQLLADIFAIQKVINPLEAMCQAFPPGQTSDITELLDDIETLKSALAGLQTEVGIRVAQNQELISQKMNVLNEEITALRANSPYRGSRSIYSGAGTASVIDIRG